MVICFSQSNIAVALVTELCPVATYFLIFSKQAESKSEKSLFVWERKKAVSREHVIPDAQEDQLQVTETHKTHTLQSSWGKPLLRDYR